MRTVLCFCFFFPQGAAWGVRRGRFLITAQDWGGGVRRSISYCFVFPQSADLEIHVCVRASTPPSSVSLCLGRWGAGIEHLVCLHVFQRLLWQVSQVLRNRHAPPEFGLSKARRAHKTHLTAPILLPPLNYASTPHAPSSLLVQPFTRTTNT